MLQSKQVDKKVLLVWIKGIMQLVNSSDNGLLMFSNPL